MGRKSGAGGVGSGAPWSGPGGGPEGYPEAGPAAPISAGSAVPEDRRGGRTGQGSTAARKAKSRGAATRQRRGKVTGRAAAAAKREALSVGDAELDEQVARSMRKYDRQCGKPTTWQEAEKREKTMAALMGNLQESLHVRVLRGSLIKRDEMRKSLDNLVAWLAEKVETFGQDLVAHAELQELNAKQRRDVARVAGESLKAVLERARQEALTHGG